MMPLHPSSAVLALVLLLPPAGAAAQQAADTLSLKTLQDDAVRHDPRGKQADLLSSQSRLRLRGLRSERLPRFDLGGLAQYQSDVAAIPPQVTGGRAPFAIHKDTYDAHLGIRQSLFDPSLSARRDVERAQLAQSQSRVASTLFSLRQAVADVYFTVLVLDAESAEVAAGITDLEAQLKVARDRIAGGDALPSQGITLEAELLRRRQAVADIAADRRAALAVLGDLTGRPFTDQDVFALPDLAREVDQARTALNDARNRPEYAEFDRSRETLDRQRDEVARRNWPRLLAIGRAGMGRPGLNPLNTEFAGYWLAGLVLEWSPFDWGRASRDREVLAIQQEIVATEEAAFTDGIRRAAVRDLAAIDRLSQDLVTDDAIITLREQVLRETRLRFNEGVLTSAEFVDRETDLLTARLARATHRVELAQARARFLTLVGLEVR